MNFIELSKNRFSTRKFLATPVEEDKILKILESAQNAPSAKNLQPHFVYVIKSKEALEKANKATPCMYGAPLAFLVCVDMNKVWKSPSEPGLDSADIDGTIVATHITLEATDLGLGSVIVRMFNIEETKKIFDLPENFKPILFIPVGYTDPNFKPSINHDSRKPLEETSKVI